MAPSISSATICAPISRAGRSGTSSTGNGAIKARRRPRGPESPRRDRPPALAHSAGAWLGFHARDRHVARSASASRPHRGEPSRTRASARHKANEACLVKMARCATSQGRKVRTQHQGQPRRRHPVRQLLAVIRELNCRAAVRFLMAHCNVRLRLNVHFAPEAALPAGGHMQRREYIAGTVATAVLSFGSVG